MSQPKSNINIVYAGRYNENENLSGPEKTAKRIFEEGSKINKTAFIQYFFDGRKYGLKKKLFGKNTLQINDNSMLYTLGLFKIFGVLKQINPGIIHIISFERFAVIFFLYRLFHKTKIIYNAHGIIAYENSELKKVPWFYKFKDRICERLFITKSDRIIFTSERSIDIGEKYFKVNESKSIILPNGIDSIFKRNQPHDNNILKAVMIYKNEFGESGLSFLKSFLNEFKVELEIYIIANKELNISDSRIELVNLMTANQLAEFYSDKDVFLSLNRYDTFSIAAAEAMASGMIPVVTRETGISRYIENGTNGFIVSYGDTEELSSVISKIINMPVENRKKISANAGNIYESLAWNRVYEMYSNIYQNIMQ